MNFAELFHLPSSGIELVNLTNGLNLGVGPKCG
jgi:hypothetical protein